MPLSENEQRLLEQMERALAAEDPKFASALRGRPSLAGKRFAGFAIALLVIGVGMIVAAVAIPLTPVGIIGFAAILIGVLVLTAPKPQIPGSPSAKSATPTKADFMKRFEQRWEDRNQGESN